MNLALDPATHAVWQRLAGTVVADKYRLDEPLGAGSQGMVWKAHNLDLDLPVAIKLLLPLSDVGLAPNRLFREARAAATLGHPGIVRIFDFGRSADGMPYLTMELLQGVSLSRHLQEVGKLSPEVAVRMILPIADALSAAHAQGIVHRDVKPDNILLSVSGGQMQPKLLDFGIASVADGEVLTQAGCVIGTPNYVPPEQARGLGDVDARADVWALCATLYECVTGAVPFAAATWIDVLRRIIDDAPDPIVSHGVKDLDLWRLIRKGLAKNPADRWQSAAAFARAAARWLLARGVGCDICGVSLESRWLKAPTASTLASGETSSGVVWWEPEARVSAPPRSPSRYRALAISASLLCIAATVGATRASGVFDSTSHRALPTSEAAFALPEQASLAAVAPQPDLVDVRDGVVRDGVDVSTASAPGVGDSAHAVDEREERPPRRPASSSSTSAPPIQSALPTFAPVQPLHAAAVQHAPRPSQTSARIVSPSRTAATPARDSLDLMNPY